MKIDDATAVMLGQAARDFGITSEQFAEISRVIGPLMPELPVPSRWSAFKRWLHELGF